MSLDPTTVAPGTTAAPTAAPTANPNINTPSGAPATVATDSNAPDADTAAGASIPKALINDPAAPTQKMAAQADNNKNSVAPNHKWLSDAAVELAGGPQFTTTYDTDGNAIRTPVRPSLAHLGLALALEVLKGGIAGGNAKDSVAAAQAGAKVADDQRAKVQQANQQQDAQAKADQNHKLAVTEANMRNYQTAVNAGKSSMAASQAFSDSFKPITDGLQDGTIALPEGVSKSDPTWETDAMAAIKNGTTKITSDLLIPVGDPKPVIGKDGQQLIVNGVPQVGHDYITLHGVGPDGKIPLTKEMQDAFVGVGIMPETKGGIGQPPWPLADIAKKSALLASINAGEQMLKDHKNDAHDLLGREPEDLDNLKAAVKTNPQMRKAVSVFSQAQMGTQGANGHIEDILNTMGQRDPASRGLLMNYLHLTEKDLDDMHNKRVEAATDAATKTPQPKALTPEEKADKLADVQLKLSQVGKNNAEAKKAEADTKKLLNDADSHDAIVDAFGTGHVAAANMAYILRSKEGQALLTDVARKYPDFDSSKAGAYPKVYDEFTSTKKNTAGGAINAGATAFKHLAELQALNTDQSRIPGTKDYQAFQDKLDTLATELASFYGNSTIPGIEGYKKTLGATFNRDAAITTQAKSMGDKMNSYEHQWYNAAPSAVYQAPIPFMDREALQARAQLDPAFKTRVPEGAAGQAKGKDGRTYWVNKQMKPIQEAVQ